MVIITTWQASILCRLIDYFGPLNGFAGDEDNSSRFRPVIPEPGVMLASGFFVGMPAEFFSRTGAVAGINQTARPGAKRVKMLFGAPTERLHPRGHTNVKFRWSNERFIHVQQPALTPATVHHERIKRIQCACVKFARLTFEIARGVKDNVAVVVTNPGTVAGLDFTPAQASRERCTDGNKFVTRQFHPTLNGGIEDGLGWGAILGDSFARALEIKVFDAVTQRAKINRGKMFRQRGSGGRCEATGSEREHGIVGALHGLLASLATFLFHEAIIFNTEGLECRQKVFERARLGFSDRTESLKSCHVLCAAFRVIVSGRSIFKQVQVLLNLDVAADSRLVLGSDNSVSSEKRSHLRHEAARLAFQEEFKGSFSSGAVRGLEINALAVRPLVKLIIVGGTSVRLFFENTVIAPFPSHDGGWARWGGGWGCR